MAGHNRYRRIWNFIAANDDALRPCGPFFGKVDIYYALQACLILTLPTTGNVTRGLLETKSTHAHELPRELLAMLFDFIIFRAQDNQTVRKPGLSGFLRGVGEVRIAHDSHRRTRTGPASVVAGGC